MAWIHNILWRGWPLGEGLGMDVGQGRNFKEDFNLVNALLPWKSLQANKTNFEKLRLLTGRHKGFVTLSFIFSHSFNFFKMKNIKTCVLILSYYPSVGKIWMNSKAIQAQGLEVQQIKSAHFQARLSWAVTHTPFVLCRWEKVLMGENSSEHQESLPFQYQRFLEPCYLVLCLGLNYLSPASVCKEWNKDVTIETAITRG